MAVGIFPYGAALYLIVSPPKPVRFSLPRCSYWRTPRWGFSSTGYWIAPPRANRPTEVANRQLTKITVATFIFRVVIGLVLLSLSDRLSIVG